MGNQNSTDEVKLGPRIGEGCYGEVFKATWRNKPVAAKRIRSFFIEDAQYRRNQGKIYEDLKKEWTLLSSLQHPNIVEYYTVILVPNEPPIIVTELCDCDLQCFIRNTKPRVPFPEIVSIMLDVAEGLRYLHGQSPPIAHRDLASKNILLTQRRQAKIADLGLAKAFPDGAMMATAAVGTPIYAAPETFPQRIARGFFSQKSSYREEVDIFSFGAILLEVIVGHLPSYLPDPVSLDGEVLPEYMRRSEDIEEMGTNHPLRPLVIECFHDKPDERPSAVALVDFLKNRKPVATAAKANPLSQYKNLPSSVERMNSPCFDYGFKVVILGESNVGKTSIIRKFLNPSVSLGENAVTTISPGDYFERLQLRGKTVHLHIVDTPGESKSAFHQIDCMIPQIYRAANGAVIVFDVSDQDSFWKVPNWLKMIQTHCGHSTPVILVGNKTDTHPRDWQIQSQSVEEFASDCNMFYIETSAMGYENIDEIFSVLLEKLIQLEDRYAGSINARRSLLKGSSPFDLELSTITDKSASEPMKTEGTVTLSETTPGQGEEGRANQAKQGKKCC